MDRQKRRIALFVVLLTLVFGRISQIHAQDTPSRTFLTPSQKIAEFPIFEALREYQMRNVFSQVVLSRPMMEQVAMAAFHSVHPANAARNDGALDEPAIDLYVVTKDALYVYDKADQGLRHVGDDRAGTVLQKYLARREALAGLIYVIDSRASGGRQSAGDAALVACAQAGMLSQNVNLYCLSEGLRSMVKEKVDGRALARAMELRDDQEIALVQFVGYPRQGRSKM